jgi:hypothetical protein
VETVNHGIRIDSPLTTNHCISYVRLRTHASPNLSLTATRLCPQKYLMKKRTAITITTPFTIHRSSRDHTQSPS